MRQLVKNLFTTKALRVAALSLTITFIAGPMEAWADGNIFYNFSFIGNDGGRPNATVNGTFEVQPGGGGGSYPDLIVGITGTVTGFPDGSGPFNILLNQNTFLSNNNYFKSTSPWVSIDGVGFLASDGFNFKIFDNDPGWAVLNDYDYSTGTLTVSISQ